MSNLKPDKIMLIGGRGPPSTSRKLIQRLKGLSFKFRIKICYNPRQDIWNKPEKSSKIGEEKNSLISTFACFLTAIANV